MNRAVVIIPSLLLISLFPAMQSLVHATGTTVYITIYDYGFTPKIENITTGTTVVWNNTGGVGHTVYSQGSPSFQSSAYTVQPYGQTGQHMYSLTFNQPGVYQYYCSIHPFMTGTLNVTGSPVSPPSGGGGGGSTGTTPPSGLGGYIIPIAIIAAIIMIGAIVFLVRRKRSGQTPMPPRQNPLPNNPGK